MKPSQALTLALLTASSFAPGQTLPGRLNLSTPTPAAPGGSLNVHWQNDGGSPIVSISAYALYPTVQVACPATGDLSLPVNTAIGLLTADQGGIIDARRCTAATTWLYPITIDFDDTTLLLPCATIAATQPVTVATGVRNVAVHGCGYQGSSAFSGLYGGTIWDYQASGPAWIVGDPTLAADTQGFAMADMEVSTVNAGTGATAIALYRVQEASLERLYILGAPYGSQTGLLLDGTGNYTGGTFDSLHISGFYTGVMLTGSATGAANASTFLRVHINCPTNSGTPIVATTGVKLAYGDGNTFAGGDIEGCYTMLELGAGATDNTFVGVRNENSITQIEADSGSSYNLWVAGGTLFTGQLTDAGLHNSFTDSFHRSFNNLNGDLWRSQSDATIANHVYTGLGLGTVRGRQDEWVTDLPSVPGSYQNAWLWGPGDGSTGLQTWVLQDLLNDVPRLSVGQYTTAGGNNQTALNGAGTGAVILNGSTHGGTGGTVFGSGGATPATVATIDSNGDGTLFGYLRFFASSAEQWRFNCASSSACNIDDFTTGSAVHRIRVYAAAGLDIDSEGSQAVTVNNTSGSGTGGFIVYEGGTNYTVAAFTVTSAGATSNPGNNQVGSASGTGTQTIGNHLNQLATADFAGHCAMAAATTCTISFQHSWNSIPACSVAPQATQLTPPWYTWATNVITVHMAATATGTFAAVCVGDPN